MKHAEARATRADTPQFRCTVLAKGISLKIVPLDIQVGLMNSHRKWAGPSYNGLKLSGPPEGTLIYGIKYEPLIKLE